MSKCYGSHFIIPITRQSLPARRRDEGVTTLSVRRHLISASRLSDYDLWQDYMPTGCCYFIFTAEKKFIYYLSYVWLAGPRRLTGHRKFHRIIDARNECTQCQSFCLAAKFSERLKQEPEIRF